MKNNMSFLLRIYDNYETLFYFEIYLIEYQRHGIISLSDTKLKYYI
jgi:hypothetical protein